LKCLAVYVLMQQLCPTVSDLPGGTVPFAAGRPPPALRKQFSIAFAVVAITLFPVRPVSPARRYASKKQNKSRWSKLIPCFGNLKTVWSPCRPCAVSWQNAECVPLFPVPLPTVGSFASNFSSFVSCNPSVACLGVNSSAVLAAFSDPVVMGPLRCGFRTSKSPARYNHCIMIASIFSDCLHLRFRYDSISRLYGIALRLAHLNASDSNFSEVSWLGQGSMHASIACLLFYEDYVWVSIRNAMKAKQSKHNSSQLTFALLCLHRISK
jgi:hypothetical protein